MIKNQQIKKKGDGENDGLRNGALKVSLIEMLRIFKSFIFHLKFPFSLLIVDEVLCFIRLRLSKICVLSPF